jgi:hypothetical protein
MSWIFGFKYLIAKILCFLEIDGYQEFFTLYILEKFIIVESWTCRCISEKVGIIDKVKASPYNNAKQFLQLLVYNQKS